MTGLTKAGKPKKKPGPKSGKRGSQIITGPRGPLLVGLRPDLESPFPKEEPPLFAIAVERYRRPPLITSAEHLFEIAQEYFEWNEANPLWEDKVTSYQGVNTHEPSAKKRLMSRTALCNFLGINMATWTLWRTTRPELAEAINTINEHIDMFNRDGAAADLLNANFVARVMGIADRQEVTGKNGGPIAQTNDTFDLSKLTDEELNAYKIVAAAAERHRQRD